MGLFVWLVSFAIGVRFSLTLYMVPGGALEPEMTTHYDERTTLNSFRWLPGWTGSPLLTAAGWFYFRGDRDSQVGAGRLEATLLHSSDLAMGTCPCRRRRPSVPNGLGVLGRACPRTPRLS